MNEERLRLPRLYAIVDADHTGSRVPTERLTSTIATSPQNLRRATAPSVRREFEGNPNSIGGLEGIRSLRRLTSKPLVAMGGVTRANARAMIEAGADAIVVAENLFGEPRRSAEEFLAILV